MKAWIIFDNEEPILSTVRKTKKESVRTILSTVHSANYKGNTWQEHWNFWREQGYSARKITIKCIKK